MATELFMRVEEVANVIPCIIVSSTLICRHSCSGLNQSRISVVSA